MANELMKSTLQGEDVEVLPLTDLNGDSLKAYFQLLAKEQAETNENLEKVSKIVSDSNKSLLKSHELTQEFCLGVINKPDSTPEQIDRAFSLIESSSYNTQTTIRENTTAGLEIAKKHDARQELMVDGLLTAIGITAIYKHYPQILQELKCLPRFIKI